MHLSVNSRTCRKTFKYYLRWQELYITTTVYKGLRDYLASLPRTFKCPPDCLTQAEIYLRFINQEDQVNFTKDLVKMIEHAARNRDDRARIAISLVQHIPYDYEKARSLSSLRYPYEVLYDEKGVCGEKSLLLALLLKRLGFGVVLLDYEAENHMAVGIKCPKEYSNYLVDGIGYCFVETAKPTIVTHIPKSYTNIGELKSQPEVIFVSDGASFDGVFEEYKDAREWEYLLELMEKNNNVLDQYHYQRWQYLVQKYGLEVGK